MSDTWRLWIAADMAETVEGVAIVHRASDYGLRLMPNGLDNSNRRKWCIKLAAVLNAARQRGEL